MMKCEAIGQKDLTRLSNDSLAKVAKQSVKVGFLDLIAKLVKEVLGRWKIHATSVANERFLCCSQAFVNHGPSMRTFENLMWRVVFADIC